MLVIVYNGIPKFTPTFFSLGYAFCTFENHDVALKCLRVLNNHPSIFSKEKRPIVEFAVENAKAVKLLADRRKDFP